MNRDEPSPGRGMIETSIRLEIDSKHIDGPGCAIYVDISGIDIRFFPMPESAVHLIVYLIAIKACYDCGDDSADELI